MTKIKIKFGDKNKVNEEIQKALERRLDNALNDGADRVGTESDKNLRDPDEGAFDTGFLAGSLVVDKERWLHKEIGYSAVYGPYVEYGTRPHWTPIKPIYDWLYRKRKDLGIKITSKKKTTLKDGNTYNVSLLSVAIAIIKNIKKHGTKAKPFLRPAFYLVKSQLNEILKKGMKKKV